ncbi:peptidase C19 family protein [Abortiporus biennis]
MPPKRTRRSSPSAPTLATGEKLKRAKLAGNEYSAWGWVGTEVTNVSEITQEHRLATCGFSKHSHYPLCPNKYSPKPRESPPQEENAETVEGELDDDVIVISDDESSSCDSKVCRNNPNCLNYLGQDKWESEEKSRQAYVKLANLGENPITNMRDDDLPVGLKNLGATCYANALLQVWFQDLPFRHGVYKCQPTKDDDRKFEETPIFQLQVTFAAMQESTQSAFNPVKLMESLKLRTTEQQDAQEFHKLFMAHLETEFHKQTVPGLKSLLNDQFQGKQAYGTLCMNCGNRSERDSEFLEIEVNIQNNATLEDCIESLLEPEEMSGDNQYLCSVCESLQDAKRYTEFRELPPVLHVSLLRFVFDLQSMERRKSKLAISFPMTLDMDHFVGSEETRKSKAQTTRSGRTSKNLYHLRGVLLHKGASAYHGHYEAQVFDVKNKAWYQFNDETVTEIQSLGPKGKAASPNGSQHNKGKAAINGKTSEEVNGKAKGKEIRRPPRKKARIDDSDVEIVDGPSSREKSESPEEDDHISSKDAYMLIYARVPETNGTIISNGVATHEPDFGVSSNGDADPVPPARALGVVQGINEKYDEVCKDFKGRREEAKREFARKRNVVMDIYRSWSLSSNEEDSVVVSRQALEWWLGRYIMKPPKEKEKNDSEKSTIAKPVTDGDQVSFPNSDIMCEHGQLDPGKANNMKRISKSAYARIQEEDNCRFVPEFEPSNICAICTDNIFLERLYRVQHPQIVERFDEVSSVEEDEPGYWISRMWLKDWRLSKPKMHTPSLPDPPPDDPEYDAHVKCEHGGLCANMSFRRRISVEGYHLLKELFPEWNAVSTDTEICAVCETLLHISKEDKREVRRQAEEEKARLKHTYDNALLGNTALLENIPCALIVAQFLRAWKSWLLRPTEVPRPDSLDNSKLICEHGLLSLDPNVPGDLDTSVCVVKRTDWDVFESLYPSGPFIGIENTGTGWKHDLEVCDDCRKQKRTTFDSTELTIRILRPSDPIPTPGTYSEQNIAEEPTPGPSTLHTYGSRKVGGLRQSKRIRQGKAVNRRRKVLITRWMTVKELKITLSEDMNIPTLYQRLFYRGTEIQDNDATLISLGIMSNDILDLKEEAEDVDMLNSDGEEEGSHKRKADEGQGFGGTVLGASGSNPNNHEPVSSSHSSSPAPSSSTPKSCPACTFENPPDVLACTMCDTLFDTDIVD